MRSAALPPCRPALESIMSAAPAATADAAPAAKGGKKKLIIIIAAVLVLVLGGGGAAFFMMKKPPADGEEAGDDGGGHGKAKAEAPAAKAKPKHDPKHPPTFVPLDPFTVNLADRESERYAQVAVTLEIDDAKTADELKLYMPAIRNNILMVLSHKTAEQLLTREGKEKLATSILYASVRPLGYDIEEDEDEADAAAADAPKKKKKKKKAAPLALPVTAVHFSNFIVQ
jgi:flagellar FliL protein